MSTHVNEARVLSVFYGCISAGLMLRQKVLSYHATQAKVGGGGGGGGLVALVACFSN